MPRPRPASLVPILTLAVLAALPRAAGAGEPLWPLDLPTRYLTSNFMEYRPGRFHAGLDLKTRTVTGFPVRAAEDGRLTRLRATPTAYGRVVYLRGVSGRTYVYAHLERFSDALRARVEAERARTGRYRVRLQFRGDEVPVRRGDVLGLTGQSGTAGPHLHFEVRDAANRPIDPQVAGFAVPDTIAPEIRTLRAWPASPGARIGGEEGEHVLDATGADGLRGELPALHVTGPVAFSARIVEIADIRGHRLEPAEIVLRVDGEAVFRSRNDGYAFSENARQRLEWTAVPDVRERWLHRHPANDLAGREGGTWYLGPDGDGLAPGTHTVSLRAVDRAGNAAEATFVLVVGEDPSGAGDAPAPAWRREPVSPLVATPDSAAVITVSPFFDTPSAAVHAARPGLRRLVLDPAAGDPVQAPLVVYAVPAAPDSVQARTATDQGLGLLGSAREFVAGDWPLEASLPLPFAAPAAAPGPTWGVYRWDGREWDHVCAWPDGARAEVMAAVDRPGLHAVLADLAPPLFAVPDGPVVVGPGSPSGTPEVTNPRWEVLPIPVRDAGSGVDPATLAVTLDGAPLVVEPDPPRDRLLVAFPDDLPPGRHVLEFAVADRAGHEARARLEVLLEDR